jgi:hypothetical protein
MLRMLVIVVDVVDVFDVEDLEDVFELEAVWLVVGRTTTLDVEPVDFGNSGLRVVVIVNQSINGVSDEGLGMETTGLGVGQLVETGNGSDHVGCSFTAPKSSVGRS